eukprot:1016795-Pelagomonas_calceolata.AAC.4
MEAWLRGVGCVPIQNLMEDAATAEISRQGSVTDKQGIVIIKKEVLHHPYHRPGTLAFDIFLFVLPLRSQVWQWVRHNVHTAEGRSITPEWVTTLLEEDVSGAQSSVSELCALEARPLIASACQSWHCHLWICLAVQLL